MRSFDPPVIRNPIYLFLAFTALCALAGFVNLIPPETLWQYVIFYVLIGSVIWSLAEFICMKESISFLITGGTLVFLILRSLNLRGVIYPILIIGFIITALSLRRKDTRQKS